MVQGVKVILSQSEYVQLKRPSPTWHLHTEVHSSAIGNSEKVEATKMSINE